MPRTEYVDVAGFDGLRAELAGRRVLALTSPRRRFLERLPLPPATRVFDRAEVHVPLEVVVAAEVALGDAEVVVALGGGASIGLGKALRVRHPSLGFIALPTTYSGSEMTTLWGTTTGFTKQTGRSPAASPDLVIYHPDLVADLPVALAVQSLLNGLAHVISILSTGSIPLGELGDEVAAAVRAIEGILAGDTKARALGQRAASRCGAAFERGTPGAQHALAHLLGGALRVEHAALHAILLPHFTAWLRTTQPALGAALDRVLGHAPAEHYLADLLARAGAPVTLAALGPAVTRDAVERVLATRPELPASIALAALG